MKDVSIVIVSYNTEKLLMECINSIVENVSSKITYEVIVVDNASSDGSVAQISKLKSQNQNIHLKVIENTQNVGFSAANNIGVEASSARYVLFLNSDTVLHKNTLETMVAFMDANKSAGAATCKLVMPNGKLDDAAHRGFPTPWNAITHFSGASKIFPKSKLFAGYSLGFEDLSKTHEIDALVGAFMLVRKEAGEQVEWWDEDYFFYGEDIDFCYKLKATGWKIYYVPEVSILHYKGVSSGIKKESQSITTADEASKKRIQTARFNAMRIFYKKHYDKKYPKLLNWLVLKGIDIKQKTT